MNTKIQAGIDLIVKMFTKRIGELGVYVGLDLVLALVVFLPMALLFGHSIYSVGNAGLQVTDISGILNPELFKLTGGLGDIFGIILQGIIPALIGGLVGILLTTVIVQPILWTARVVFITSPNNDLMSNINLAIKTLTEKAVKLVILFVYFAVFYIAIMVVFIVLLLVALLLGVPGLVLMWLIVVAGGLLAAYFLTPVFMMAPLDALMTEKTPMACIMDTLNAKNYRVPMILIAIAAGVVTNILSSIFVRIPVPFLMGIVLAVVTVCQTCIVIPFYKEYAGIAE